MPRTRVDTLLEMRESKGDQWSACTLRGRRRRTNCDAFSVAEGVDYLAVAVADGVSSLPESAEASQAAVESVREMTESQPGQRRPGLWVSAAFSAANEAVRSALPEHDRGATTLTVAMLTPGVCVIGSVGDSEAVAVDRIGQAKSLHALDQAAGRSNVLVAWLDGSHAFDPHVAEMAPGPHRLCLLTDGITKVLELPRIGQIVLRARPSEAARKLVLAANDAGATDDLTAIVCAELKGQ